MSAEDITQKTEDPTLAAKAARHRLIGEEVERFYASLSTGAKKVMEGYLPKELVELLKQ